MKRKKKEKPSGKKKSGDLNGRRGSKEKTIHRRMEFNTHPAPKNQEREGKCGGGTF